MSPKLLVISTTYKTQVATVKRMIADVYAGKLHPRIAAGLAPLIHLQLRAIEKTDLEQRIARIEKQFNELKAERVKAELDEESQRWNQEALGKRPSQAVKPYGSSQRETVDQS